MVKLAGTKVNSEAKRKPSGKRYPKAEDAESNVSEKPKREFEIDIFMGWCKSCGICAAFCPRECISRDEDGAPMVTDAKRCSGCGWCELHCPDFAISVRQRLAKAVQPEED